VHLSCLPCSSPSHARISIANQSYDVLDKHIRRLDQDLRRFEVELERERLQQEQLQEQTLKAMGKKRPRYAVYLHIVS